MYLSIYLFTILTIYYLISATNDESNDRPISEFKINDEWVALPEVFSILDFSANSSFPSDDDIEGQQQLRSSRYWGRIYIPGWPQTIQYYRAHFGTRDPPIGLTRLIFPNPRTGCSSFENIDRYQDLTKNLSYVVVVDRGICTFGSKAKIAAEVDWLSGVIVINNEPGLDHLPGPDAHDVDISVISIPQLEGTQLTNYLFTYSSTYSSESDSFIDAYIVPINCDKKQSICLPATVVERDYISLLAEGGIIQTKSTYPTIEFLLSKFGVKLPSGSLSLAIAKPIDACTNLTNIPSLTNKVVLVKRGNCSFYDKAMNIQQAKGAAIILANDKEYITRMGVDPRLKGLEIDIPVVMVTKRSYSYLAAEFYLNNNISFITSIDVSATSWFDIEKLYDPISEWPRSEAFITKKYHEMKLIHSQSPNKLLAIEEAYNLKLKTLNIKPDSNSVRSEL
mmetsp:Transcript_11546/g.10470  ORF Transcript_11546/g.10470 Transcript_11546/m.10470 type:complete len:450 (+) Transcript_11546:13-1362(+)